MKSNGDEGNTPGVSHYSGKLIRGLGDLDDAIARTPSHIERRNDSRIAVNYCPATPDVSKQEIYD